MAEYEKAIRDVLAHGGCTFVRYGKGNHDIGYSLITRWDFTPKMKSHHKLELT